MKSSLVLTSAIAALVALLWGTAAGAAPPPPILYVQGVNCPAHKSCTRLPAYFSRIRKIMKVGLPSTPLSSGAFSDSSPNWSGDHRRIAFVRESHNGLSYTIWVMNANGSGLRALTHGNVVDAEPSWSPDGKRIVFRANSPDRRTFDLYTIGVDGKGLRNVTRNADSVGALDPDWSPNGRLIVFQRMKQGSGAGTGIYTIRPDGTGLKRLRVGGQDPAWSPNGRRIAFVLPDPSSGGTIQIYLMNANGTGRTRLTRGTESTAPAWSPDGSRIVFVRGTQITLIGVSGRRLKQVTRRLHGGKFVDTPDW
jgi:Tol biopolymer transport system component